MKELELVHVKKIQRESFAEMTAFGILFFFLFFIFYFFEEYSFRRQFYTTSSMPHERIANVNSYPDLKCAPRLLSVRIDAHNINF